MANSISGNAGMAGATVTLSGAASASTTSAADGTYTFAALGAGAYTVTPTHASITFTPASRNETIVITDIANVDFVAQPTSATFTPSISYDFHHAPAAPLPSPPWTNIPNPGVPGSQLEIVGNQCVGAAAVNYGEEAYTATVFGNDQSVELIIAAYSNAGSTNGSEVDILLRGDVGSFVAGYSWDVFSNGDGTSTLQLGAGNTVSRTMILASVTPGDKLRLQIVGTLLTGFYNDVPMLSLTDSTYTSGVVGLAVSWDAVQTDTAVSLFTAGPAAFTISGSVGAAGAGDTITLGGTASASTTGAGGTGNYSFANLAPGTYYVTPSHSGKAYSPSQQTIVLIGADVTGINFTLFTPSASGANSGGVMKTGQIFTSRIESPNTSIIGTNLGTETRK